MIFQAALISRLPHLGLAILCGLVVSFSNLSQAQSEESYILKARGKKVMIARGDGSMRKGQIFIAIDDYGKRKGVIRITKVGRTKALGRLVKGRANKGWTLTRHSRKKKRSSDFGSRSRRDRDEEVFERTRGDDDYEDPGAIRNPFRAGFLLGYAMNSMTVNIPVNDTTATSEMSGNSIEYHAFGTYRIAPKALIFGTVGMQNFEVAGTTTDDACSSSNECATNISYLMATGNYKLELGDGDTKPWIAGGLGLLLPLSSESTAVDATSIGLTSVGLATAGLDYKVNRDYSLQAMIRYAYFFNNNDAVTSNLLAILAGIEFKL